MSTLKFFSDFIDNLKKGGLEYFGLYYSKYSALVADVEDPEGLNRLRLVIPHIDPNVALKTWAIPCNVFAGPNYGSQLLPKKGDTVWVSFEYGRLRNPIWSHGYYAKKEKPEEFSSTKIYGLKTPFGHLVLIDDENNIIKIAQKDGVNFVINKDGFFICKDDTKLQPLLLGDELQTQLNIEKARVKGIIDAIKNSAVTPGDGGATFKTNMTLALNLLEEPDYSNIKSEIGKIQ